LGHPAREGGAAHASVSEGRTDLGALQARLGVEIDPALLTQAITHRSWAYEHGGAAHNERLEFLGDSVLGLAVTTKLYAEFPDYDEGDLAKRRAALVSGAALAGVARGLGLGAFLLLGRGEAASGGAAKASILADAVEAIIGAAYLSAGRDAATELVLRLIAPLEAAPERFGAALDPKTSLQELADRIGAEPPRYEVEGTGPDHARIFVATVTVGGIAPAVTARAQGTSKKQAEMAAALEAWTQLSARAS
jgi:ribonuclease-3